MRVLLDTHAVLWLLTDDKRLSARARRTFADAEDVRFSVVSLWEIGIKLALRREDFRLAENWWRDIPRELTARRVLRLEVEPEHCREVALLPLHHRDPFDRMLVAQARCSNCALLSIDPQLDGYGVKRVW